MFGGSFMNNDWKYIRELHQLNIQKKIVFFIGAGVSKNSGVPTWGDLVRHFAKQIHYEHFPLSTDDYIRIPQYVYGMDESKDHENYYRLIQDVFCEEYKTNPLHDLLISLNPCHIITTNFDQLLDHYGYEVIKSDRDLLQATTGKYLIKMHGDMDNVREIVLKEDDYLQYSHTHGLIELFIKSLLIDHTFVFVGYSLNDYNLKTFISWINFLGQTQNVQEHLHPNYFLTADIQAGEAYMTAYYEHQNIKVIHLNCLLNESTQSLYDAIPLADPIGKLTYLCLLLVKQ